MDCSPYDVIMQLRANTVLFELFLIELFFTSKPLSDYYIPPNALR
jgi:hypothetical protein